MPHYNPETTIASQASEIRRLRAQVDGLRIVRQMLIERLRREHRAHAGHPAECAVCGEDWVRVVWGERIRT